MRSDGTGIVRAEVFVFGGPIWRYDCHAGSGNYCPFWFGGTCCKCWISYKSKSKEPLNKSSAALSGSFAPAYRFENLEIHKVFLRFPNLNLEQNPSLTTLAI